jgi:uncharacterized protein (DUF1501 family)
MNTSRRRFLQHALGSSALLSVGLHVPAFLARSARAAGTGTGQRVLVVVQLSGGNDGLNTVVPYGDELYAKHREVLRLGADQVLKIQQGLGLHPSMDGLARLLQENRLAIVQGVGYPNPDRSHFRSMDIWHTARPEVVDTRDGWLGRALDTVPAEERRDVAGIHLGPSPLPLALVSQHTSVPSLESLERFRLKTAGGAMATSALAELAQAPRAEQSELLDFIRRSTLNAYASSEQVQEAIGSGTSGAEYPEYALAQRLKTIAQLIDAGLSTRIYYVALDGFDTHANQLEAHAGLLREFSSSVEAFVHDLAARGQLERVLVLAFSEFGRRVAENASAGTDHGTAAPVFLAGGAVRAGLIGEHPSLADLDQEGDVKFHTDFRQVYAELLDRWLGCPSQTVLGREFAHVGAVAS